MSQLALPEFARPERLADTLELMVQCAREAGLYVADAFARHRDVGLAVEEKEPGDPVTEADRGADALITTCLRRAFGDVPIVSEESVPDSAELADRLAKPAVFFVDPIDGTREFVARRTEFAVMLGLAVRGEASLGVVVEPARGGDLYAGGPAVGAFAERNGERTPLSTSTEAVLARSVAVVSRSSRPPLIEGLLSDGIIASAVPCGSVGVKVARVCERAADVYLHIGHGMHLWDICGPEALLRGAGGTFSDHAGCRYRYDWPPSKGGMVSTAISRGVVATNGPLRDALVSAVRQASSRPS